MSILPHYESKSNYRQAAHYLRLLVEIYGPEPDLLLSIAKYYVMAADVRRAIAAYEELRNAMQWQRSAKAKEYKKFAEWQIAVLKSQVPSPPIGPSRSSKKQPTVKVLTLSSRETMNNPG